MDESTKLLKEKLTVIQEAQVAALSSGFAATSNLQLLRRDALLKNFSFQPQVLSVVRLRGHMSLLLKYLRFWSVCITSDTWTGCQDLQSLSRRQLKKLPHPKSPRRCQRSRHNRPGLLCLTLWGLQVNPPFRGPSHRTRSPFMHSPAREVVNVPMCPTVASLLEQPSLQQQADVDVTQVGACLAGFAPQWPSLQGPCWATNTVEEGVGLDFQHRPQLTHHSIVFCTRNSHQDPQQAMDALLSKEAIERVLNETSLGFYSWLFLVPKKIGDLHPVIDLSALNHHLVVPHFKMETQASVRAAIRSQEWTVHPVIDLSALNRHLVVPHFKMET